MTKQYFSMQFNIISCHNPTIGNETTQQPPRGLWNKEKGNTATIHMIIPSNTNQM
jgi:hypothetical protein